MSVLSVLLMMIKGRIKGRIKGCIRAHLKGRVRLSAHACDLSPQALVQRALWELTLERLSHPRSHALRALITIKVQGAGERVPARLRVACGRRRGADGTNLVEHRIEIPSLDRTLPRDQLYRDQGEREQIRAAVEALPLRLLG